MNSQGQVTSSNGGPVLWSGPAAELWFSLDDTLLAAGIEGAYARTDIYLNYLKTTSIPGTAAGWVPGNLLWVDGAAYSSAGEKQASPVPSYEGPLQVLSATSVLDRGRAAIYSLSTGEETWSVQDAVLGQSAVAGSQIAFVTTDNQLAIEPY